MEKIIQILSEHSGIPLVYVPKEDFVMGSKDDDPAAWDDEKPQHIFKIPYDYWCAKNPITNSQFSQFIASTGYPTSAEQKGWAWVWKIKEANWEKVDDANWHHPQGPGSDLLTIQDHPVVCVSFYDALAYIRWLNAAFIQALPEGYSFSLPSEVEWEKAARGPEGLRYPWGNEFNPGLCNWCGNKDRKGTTWLVGSKPPESDSPYGCSGMAGNTWEWTITLWGKDKDQPEFNYPYQMFDGREAIDAGEDYFRIIRGGSFKDDEKGVRSACRDLDPPGLSFNNLGFRFFLIPENRKAFLPSL